MTRTQNRGSRRRYDILLIESQPQDAAPFIESFEETDATETVHVVSDGDEALEYIHQKGEYEGAPRPDLIILDLHVSGTSGEDILSELNGQPELRSIPLLVFTTSDTEEVVARCYELSANAYLDKPDTEEEFVTLAQTIEDFWLKLAHLPPKRE